MYLGIEINAIAVSPRINFQLTTLCPFPYSTEIRLCYTCGRATINIKYHNYNLCCPPQMPINLYACKLNYYYFYARICNYRVTNKSYSDYPMGGSRDHFYDSALLCPVLYSTHPLNHDNNHWHYPPGTDWLGLWDYFYRDTSSRSSPKRLNGRAPYRLRYTCRRRCWLAFTYSKHEANTSTRLICPNT